MLTMFSFLRNKSPLEKAKSLIEAGQYEKALNQLNRHIETERASFPGYYFRGHCHFKLNNESKSIADFLKCVELELESVKWLKDDAFREMFKRHFYKELEELNARLKKFQTSELLERRGFIKLLVNKTITGALNDFTKAIELNPVSSKPYFYRSVLNKDEAQNISDLTKAIEIEPYNDHFYFLRAKNKMRQGGHHTESLKDYDKAIQLNPNIPEYYHERGIVKSFNKDLESALSDFNRAIQLNPNNGNYYNTRAVIIYSQNGKVSGAEKDLKKARKLGIDVANDNLFGINNELKTD